MLPKWKQEYDSLHSKASNTDDDEENLGPALRKKPSFPLSRTIPWMCTAILLLYSISITFAYQIRRQQTLSYETGFPTEFTPALSALGTGLHTLRFGGDIHFHANGSTYLKDLEYTGPPNPQIDQNWQELIGDRYFRMTEREARDMWGEEYDGYHEVVDGEKMFIGGLDILHTLHCVNQFRKLLDPAYYQQDEHMSRNHNYHCIDQLRQYLMCYGDLTPVKTFYVQAMDDRYVGSNMEHTCRDFSAIRQWIRGRDVVW